MFCQSINQSTFQCGQTVSPLRVTHKGQCLPGLIGQLLFHGQISFITILDMIKLTFQRQIIRIEFVQSLKLNLRPMDLQDVGPKK